MSHFFSKIRSSAGAPNSPSGSSPSKKDIHATPLRPLEKLLVTAGPIREDGSDKFWGLENFGNTCYANSILQCLYYTVPFREKVLNFPIRSPQTSILTTPDGHPRLVPLSQAPNAQSPSKPKQPPVNSARNPGGPAPIAKSEDKDSPDAKKKAAILAGPLVALTQENTAAYGLPETLLTSTKDLFEAVLAHTSRVGVLAPHRFLEVLKTKNEMFRSAMHQDAHEFLNLLLNEIIENVDAYEKKLEHSKDPPESMDGQITKSPVQIPAPSTWASPIQAKPSWVHDLFEGLLTSETRCLTCENVSQRDEAFLDLSVDLDQHSSVTACLRKFSEEEMLCERNKFHCDLCGGLQEAEKRMKIKKLPRVLALHLKRFKYTEDLQRLQKLFHRVVYPYHLRLFNTTDDAEDPDRLYELYAVVIHIGGGPYHGHYVAVVKTEGRGWLLFDDENVEPVDKDFVRNFFGDKPGLACAYLLFYRETTVEAIREEQRIEDEAIAAVTAYDIKDAPKESTGLGIKTNGFLMNGIHHVRSAVSPPTEGITVGSDLDKVASAPIPDTPSAALLSPSSPKVTSPVPEVAQVPKTSEPMSKKERKAAEKEKEKVEKEREKAEKLRSKALEADKREASKSSSREDGNSSQLATTGEQDLVNQEQRENSNHYIDAGQSNEPSSGGGTLSRFRMTSKSMNRKARFWSSKDPLKENAPLADGDTHVNGLVTPSDKEFKSKNPFSTLKRKTSHMML